MGMNAEEAERRGIKDMTDLEETFPGMADTVRRFFTIYKVPSGKGENKFAYNGEFQSKTLADDVIGFLHQEWREMMMNCSIGSEEGGFGYFNTHNTKVDWSPCLIEQDNTEQEFDKQAPARPD